MILKKLEIRKIIEKQRVETKNWVLNNLQSWSGFSHETTWKL